MQWVSELRTYGVSDCFFHFPQPYYALMHDASIT